MPLNIGNLKKEKKANDKCLTFRYIFFIVINRDLNGVACTIHLFLIWKNVIKSDIQKSITPFSYYIFKKLKHIMRLLYTLVWISTHFYCVFFFGQDVLWNPPWKTRLCSDKWGGMHHVFEQRIWSSTWRSPQDLSQPKLIETNSTTCV